MTALVHSRRARWTSAVLAVLLAAGAAVALTVGPHPGARVVASLPPALHAPTVTASLQVAAPPAKPAPKVPHDVVAPAAPTGFRVSGPAFDITAHVCGMANIRPLDPPGDQYHTVCWVREGFGVAPGTDSGGTSYILGHSWAKAPLVLTPLSVTAMNAMDMAHPVPLAGVPVYPTTVLDGYQIVLTTPNGVLTYVVDSAYAVDKMQAANVAPLMDEHTPNRVVIITCGVHDSQDIDVNIIVNATLVSSKAGPV